MTHTGSLAAVLVTYNRADQLGKVLDALAGQTRLPDVIYVIDNASTDDTAEVIERRADALPLIHHRLPNNLGGAGGFHAGLKLAWESGHDFFWVSDDDAYPHPDAIEILERRMIDFEAETGFQTPYTCSRVDWTDGTLCEMNVPFTVWDWPRWYRADRPVFLITSCSFVSLLVRREAVTRHGLPIAEYFIWHDDVEYTQRLARTYPGLYCPDSRVVHDTPENKGVNFGLVNESNIWKFKYGARNETSRRLRDQHWYGVAVFLRHVRRQMKAQRVPRRLQFEVFGSIFKGLFFRPEIEYLVENTATRGRIND